MAKNIIAAARTYPGLKRTVRHTLVEMVHMGSIYGVLKKSLSYIAEKCECSKQTVIAHIKLLIKRGILAKYPPRRKPGTYLNEINTYRLLIHWPGKPPALPKSSGSQKMSPNLPTPPKDLPEAQLLEGMKEGRFADLIRRKMYVLRNCCTEGSSVYLQLKEEIDTLIEGSRWASKDTNTLLQEP